VLLLFLSPFIPLDPTSGFLEQTRRQRFWGRTVYLCRDFRRLFTLSTLACEEGPEPEAIFSTPEYDTVDMAIT
jgi:hypothetical protein